MGGIQAKEGSLAEVHGVRGGQLILRVAANPIGHQSTSSTKPANYGPGRCFCTTCTPLNESDNNTTMLTTKTSLQPGQAEAKTLATPSASPGRHAYDAAHSVITNEFFAKGSGWTVGSRRGKGCSASFHAASGRACEGTSFNAYRQQQQQIGHHLRRSGHLPLRYSKSLDVKGNGGKAESLTMTALEAAACNNANVASSIWRCGIPHAGRRQQHRSDGCCVCSCSDASLTSDTHSSSQNSSNSSSNSSTSNNSPSAVVSVASPTSTPKTESNHFFGVSFPHGNDCSFHCQAAECCASYNGGSGSASSATTDCESGNKLTNTNAIGRFTFLIGPVEGRSYLLQQNIDVLEKIFDCLTPRELALLCLTCRSMNFMVHQYLDYCIDANNLRAQLHNFYTSNALVLLPHEIDLKDRLDSNSRHELLLFSARHQFQGKTARRHAIADVDRFDLLPKPVKKLQQQQVDAANDNSDPAAMLPDRPAVAALRRSPEIRGGDFAPDEYVREMRRRERDVPVSRERDVALKRDVVVVKKASWLYFRHTFAGIEAGDYLVRFRLRLSNVRWDDGWGYQQRVHHRPPLNEAMPPYQPIRPVQIRVYQVISEYETTTVDAPAERQSRENCKTKRLLTQRHKLLLEETMAAHWWPRIEASSSNHISTLVLDRTERTTDGGEGATSNRPGDVNGGCVKSTLSSSAVVTCRERQSDAFCVHFDRTSDWVFLCTRRFSVAPIVNRSSIPSPDSTNRWRSSESDVRIEFDDRANNGYHYIAPNATIDSEDSNGVDPNALLENYPEDAASIFADGRFTHEVVKRGLIWDFVEVKSVDEGD